MFDQEEGWISDRYQKISILGEGGMGIVYKAYDTTLQRDVAIKVMHPHIASRPNFHQRFLEEARAAARMDHPGIVQVFDLGSHGPSLFIVMKFIPGDNLEILLRELRNKNRWITLKEAVALARQVAVALDYAHQRHVLHRDVKPSNIMIVPEPSEGLTYRAVITDLGLAKPTESDLASLEDWVGTPSYMSPEHARRESMDGRADVYSSGVVLYELVTGRVPYPLSSLKDAAEFHRRPNPPRLEPPGSLRPGLPSDLEEIIVMALEREPDKRFQSASLFAGALARLNLNALEESQPSGLENAADLITIYQQSVTRGLMDDIIEPPSFTPGGKARDRLQVIKPDKTSSLAVMKPDGMTIGRGLRCDILLEDRKASRVHARLDYDGLNYLVTDLNSSNGTYLGENRLPPGIRTIWQPSELLRISNTVLRLLRVQKDWPDFAMIVDDQPIRIEQIFRSPGEGRVGVYVKNVRLSVDPGEELSIDVYLANLCEESGRFQVELEGLPEAWEKSAPQLVQLKPGDQDQLCLHLHPPRTSASRAGRYPISIRASSLEEADQVAVIKAILTVRTFYQFHSELAPVRLSAHQPGRITIENQGNAPEIFKIALQTPAENLNFQPKTAQLTVSAGKSAVAEFYTTARRPRWLGRRQLHPYTARIQSTRGDPVLMDGQLETRALLPGWILAPVLLLIFGATIVLANNGAMPGPWNKPSTSTHTLTSTLTHTLTLTPSLTSSATRTVFKTATINATRAMRQTQTMAFMLKEQLSGTATAEYQQTADWMGTATADAGATVTSQAETLDAETSMMLTQSARQTQAAVDLAIERWWQTQIAAAREETFSAMLTQTANAIPSDTPTLPTDTPITPTDTPITPTDTPITPTDTLASPTDTPVPPKIISTTPIPTLTPTTGAPIIIPSLSPTPGDTQTIPIITVVPTPIPSTSTPLRSDRIDWQH